MKKIVSLVTILSLLMTSKVWMISYAEKQENLNVNIVEDFEEGTGEWNLGKVSDESYQAELTNENGCLKFTTSESNSDWAAYENGNVGSIVRKINGDEGITFKEGKKIVIRTKLKSTGNARVLMKINRPENGGGTKEYSRYLYEIFEHRGDSVMVVNGDADGVDRIALTNGASGLKKDAWVDVTIAIDGANNTVDYRFNALTGSDSPDSSYGKSVNGKSFLRPDRDGMEGIKTISLTTRDITAGDGSTETVLIDFLKVYEIDSSAKSEMVCDNISNTFIGNTYFDVKFNVPMYETTLNKDTIKLFDDENNEIFYDYEFFAETGIYRIIPEEMIEDGKYYISINKNQVKLNDEISRIVNNDISSKIDFTYYVTEPPVMPQALNVKIVGKAKINGILTGKYDFYDTNKDDEEQDSEYSWYISEELEDGYSRIEGENSIEYNIKEEDEGRYIKFAVVPYSNNEPQVGEIAYSLPIGPIEGSNVKNLLVNGDFENGIEPWVMKTPWENYVFELSDTSHQGEKSLMIKGRTSNQTNWGQNVVLEKNKTYLFEGYAKLCEDSSISSAEFDAFCFSSGAGITTPYAETEKTKVTKDEWQRILYTLKTDSLSSSVSTHISLTCWPNNKKGYDYYVDDLYLGELQLSDISADIPEEIVIPKKNEDAIKISLDANVLNQLGTQTGLYNEYVSWEQIDIPKGVYVENGDLYITSDATAGNVVLQASCVPNYSGAEEEDTLIKYFTVQLLPNDDTMPYVENVKLSGIVESGNTLSLNYNYYQVNDYEDNSKIEWYYGESYDGEYKKIEGVAGLTYKVEEKYSGKFIKVKITPDCSMNIANIPIWSNAVSSEKKPEARDIKIDEGKKVIGSVLKGKYEFYDINDDAEGETSFQWYRSDSKTGTMYPIEGAIADTYTLTEDDVNKYIIFGVTPISQREPKIGDEKYSVAMKGPVFAEAKNVSVKKMGESLVGQYEYNHEYGYEQGKSLYTWYKDGKVVGNSIELSNVTSGTYEFEIVPVCVEAPYEGKAMKVSYKIQKKSSSSGGGGSSPKTSVYVGQSENIKEIEKQESVPQKKETDYDEHWAKEYIERAIETKIMSADEDGNFLPDRQVERKEIISYIADIIDLEETEYKDIFEDVTKEDTYGKKLQAMVDAGIISEDIKFNPNRFVSREEVSKIVMLALKVAEVEFEEKEQQVEEIFVDGSLIAEWAKPYVKKSYESGMFVGVGNGCFAPKGNITNAQMAVLLDRIRERMEVVR